MKEQYKEIKETIERELPDEISGFKRRVACYGGFSTIIYAKNGKQVGKYLGTETKLDEHKSDVLYEVFDTNLRTCLEKMRMKIELNKKVREYYSNFIVINFNPAVCIEVNKKKIFYNPYEVYLVLDTNVESQFLCVVSINPINEASYIIKSLSHLRKEISNKSIVKLTEDDYNYEDFASPDIVHFYAKTFEGHKDKLRLAFKKSFRNVQFRDSYFFHRHDPIYNKQIILCEGKNVHFLNALGVEGVRFSDELNSYTIFQNVKTEDRKCLRDKDLLLNEEIRRLKRKYPLYCILDFYCIENYLYHPDNLTELVEGFDKYEYMEEIAAQKNMNLEEILNNFNKTRKSYTELTENHIKPVDGAYELFKSEITSDKFEEFYQHFDMKSKFKKSILQKYSLNTKKLSSTSWFKQQIVSLI